MNLIKDKIPVLGLDIVERRSSLCFREAFNKKTGYLMTSIKKVGGGLEKKPNLTKVEK